MLAVFIISIDWILVTFQNLIPLNVFNFNIF